MITTSCTFPKVLKHLHRMKLIFLIRMFSSWLFAFAFCFYIPLLDLKSGSYSLFQSKTLFGPSFAFAFAETQTSATQLRAEGDDAMHKRDFQRAIEVYTELIKKEPDRQINYYKRSVAHYLKKQLEPALRDAHRCVELDGTFAKGLLHRGKLHRRIGNCRDAVEDFRKALQLDSSSKEAAHQMEELSQCSVLESQADSLYKGNQWTQLIKVLEQLTSIIPSSEKYIRMDIEAFSALGDYENVLDRSRRYLMYDQNNVEMLFITAKAYEHMDEDENALKMYKAGLRLHPEHKSMKLRWKNLKKVISLLQSAEDAIQRKAFEEALAQLEKCLAIEIDNENKRKTIQLKRCKVFGALKRTEEAIKACDIVLSLDPDNIDALLERGNAKLEAELFDDAMQDFETVGQKHPNDRNVQEKVHDARIRVKKAKRKDHYKILGVSKNADDRTIKKAYKRLAILYHPDKQAGKSEAEAENAAQMFRDAAEAKEVLLDAEKRAAFDRGDDLNAGRPFNPFQQGGARTFTFAQNGGFHFRFN